jgi:hypothetical protein
LTPDDGYPNFNQFPVMEGAPPESSWGVFGADDQIGTLSFLDPGTLEQSAKLVQRETSSRSTGTSRSRHPAVRAAPADDRNSARQPSGLGGSQRPFEIKQPQDDALRSMA